MLMMAASAALAVLLQPLINRLAGVYALKFPYAFLGWVGLYTVRILAGSAATNVPVSTWLAGFSVFFFLSLAFVKRFSELEGLRERGITVTSGRGYLVGDLEQLRALGTGAAYAAVLIMTLFIRDPETRRLYRHPYLLWLVIPVLLLWLSQVWMLASRGEMHDDPVVFAITDKRSLLLGVLMAVVIWWAL